MVKARRKQVRGSKRRSRQGGISLRKVKSKTVRKPTRRARKRAWQPTPEAQKVIDTTQDVFDKTPGAKSDCNKFVKAVCAALSTDPFAAGANADAITGNIRDPNWRSANGWTGRDEDPNEAKKAADRGDLVVGGATSSDLSKPNGHVVIVVSCEKLWKGFGYGSWGTLGGVGKVNEKLTLAYKLADLPKVSYMSKTI